MKFKDLIEVLKLKIGWTWTLPTFSKKNDIVEERMDSPVQAAENWLVSICIKRGVVAAIMALSAFAATHGIEQNWGVHINWDMVQASSITAIMAGLAMLHDYLKVKKGITWL